MMDICAKAATVEITYPSGWSGIAIEVKDCEWCAVITLHGEHISVTNGGEGDVSAAAVWLADKINAAANCHKPEAAE